MTPHPDAVFLTLVVLLASAGVGFVTVRACEWVQDRWGLGASLVAACFCVPIWGLTTAVALFCILKSWGFL